MYLTTQNWPTIYKLSLEDPLAGRRAGGGGGNAAARDAAVYTERCQGCHGLNGVGSEVGPPRLAGIGSRLPFDSFRLVVHSGRGEMPAFPDMDETAARRLFDYLNTLQGANSGTFRRLPDPHGGW